MLFIGYEKYYCPCFLQEYFVLKGLWKILSLSILCEIFI